MKLVLPLFLLSCLGLFAADPTPAPDYSIENCVNHFDPAKVEPTAAGSQYWFADTDLAHGKTVKLSIVGPHLATHPPHRHDEDEFFFVLEGSAEFLLDGERRTVGPQTLLYCPSRHLHGIRNPGDTELRYLVIKQYPGPRPKPATVPGLAGYGNIVRQQLQRYPEMELQDCYKLLHQACLGSEHAVSDPAAATRWMEKELASMGTGPVEPLADPISPDGSLVRVHLRPFVSRKGDPARLVQAFVQTAATKHGTTGDLAAAWAQVIELAAEGGLPFTADAARNYGSKQAAAGWPAVHHSTRFTELYRPAYRVVAREHLADVLPKE